MTASMDKHGKKAKGIDGFGYQKAMGYMTGTSSSLRQLSLFSCQRQLSRTSLSPLRSILRAKHGKARRAARLAEARSILVVRPQKDEQ